MTIIQNRLTYSTTTNLDPDTSTLTRIISSKVYSISMRHKTTLTDLYRLTSIEDESFKLMAELQKRTTWHT